MHFAGNQKAEDPLVGVAKAVSTVDMGMLEACVRENLNQHAERRLAVLRPIELVVENWPEGEVDYLEDKREGLQLAPDVFAQMLRGDTFGKTLIVVAPDPTLEG